MNDSEGNSSTQLTIEDSSSYFDFVAIGGGAAGFFGAIAFAESAPGSRVAILEKSDSVLEKVRISGGGRCNVTHACFDPKPLTHHYPRGERNLIGPFHRWGATETVDWFEGHGVELKTESDGRMFPTTDESSTIIRCLSRVAEDLGIEVKLDCEAESLCCEEDTWSVKLKRGGSYESKAVLLATGGIRNNAGVRLAGDLGHSLVPAAPSLFTFKIEDTRLRDLAGISVEEVSVSVTDSSLQSEGPCLITHWGLSGPAILKLSAWGARELGEKNYSFQIAINWCGKRNEGEVDALLQGARESSPKKRVRSGIEAIRVPARFWQRLVETAGIEEETTWSNLLKAERRKLVKQLTGGRYSVRGKSMNKDEFVTAGGVSRDEVNFKTMESRLFPGLYFAGEVLDIDGVTGGFNFQSAWTTSRIAGESAAGAL